VIVTTQELTSIVSDIGKAKAPWLSDNYRGILLFLAKGLSESKDKEEIFDVSIDALNRLGFEFTFIAIFREDRKYSSAVRIRVESELVNRVEDYARKMMPGMTVMRYRIPIFEDGRIFRKFLLESKKALLTDNIKVSKPDEVISAPISELFDNLISKDSPLVILLPAFKRIVPYKYAMSTHIFIDGTPMGNIGIASGRELREDELNVLKVIAEMIAESLDKVGFGKNYV
jgi:hypothetical protein